MENDQILYSLFNSHFPFMKNKKNVNLKKKLSQPYKYM